MITTNPITTAWMVCDKYRESCDVVDAPTPDKARTTLLFHGYQADEDPDDIYIKRRRDLDGMTMMDARYTVWPCSQRPCPGCPCCWNGICLEEEEDTQECLAHDQA